MSKYKMGDYVWFKYRPFPWFRKVWRGARIEKITYILGEICYWPEGHEGRFEEELQRETPTEKP